MEKFLAVANFMFTILYTVEGILVLTGTVTLTPITIACACFCAGLGFFDQFLKYI